MTQPQTHPGNCPFGCDSCPPNGNEDTTNPYDNPLDEDNASDMDYQRPHNIGSDDAPGG